MCLHQIKNLEKTAHITLKTNVHVLKKQEKYKFLVPLTNVYFHNFIKLNTTELKKLYRSLFAILRLILARYCFVCFLIFLYLNFNVLHSAFMISDLTLILSLCLYTCITSGEKQLYSSPGYTATSRFEATSYHVCWWVTIITPRNTANLQWFLWQRHEFHFRSSFNPHWLEIRTIFYFKHEVLFQGNICDVSRTLSPDSTIFLRDCTNSSECRRRLHEFLTSCNDRYMHECRRIIAAWLFICILALKDTYLIGPSKVQKPMQWR